MTNTNKILLTALLNLEASFNYSEQYISQASLPFSIQFDFSKFYDLFQTIISAFEIPGEKHENLYNILDNFIETKISINQVITEIEKLI